MAPKLGRQNDTEKTANGVVPMLRPYRQGSLDSYCGFYAIINAMLRLKPQAFADESSAGELFLTMVKAATRICSPHELFSKGMDDTELEYVARAATRHTRRKGHSFKLTRLRLERLVEGGNTAARIVAANEALKISVILYVEHLDQAHWSVLKKIKGERVDLFDSDAMRAVNVMQCVPILMISHT